jgi:hypothetical protein
MTTNQDISQAIERTMRDLDREHLHHPVRKQLTNHLAYLLKLEAEVLSFYEVDLGNTDVRV